MNTAEVPIGDFQNEKLRPVTYAREALPPLSVTDMAPERLEEAVIARLTRKRSEWAHEKEWRFITGEVGPKHYQTTHFGGCSSATGPSQSMRRAFARCWTGARLGVMQGARFGASN